MHVERHTKHVFEGCRSRWASRCQSQGCCAPRIAGLEDRYRAIDQLIDQGRKLPQLLPREFTNLLLLGAREAALGHDINDKKLGLVDGASNSGEKPDDDFIRAIYACLNMSGQPVGEHVVELADM